MCARGRQRRRGPALGLALALAVAAPAAADAGPAAADAGPTATATVLRARPLAVDVRRPIGDGHSLTAWMTGTGTLVSRDGRGRTRALALPADCAPGRFAAAGGGVVLVQCPEPLRFPPPAPRYVVIRPATGSVARLRVRNPYDGDPRGAVPILSEIGRRWARGVINVGPAVESVYVQWRSGLVLEGGQDPFGPWARLDLGAPSLARPLCGPHVRQPWTDIGLSPHDRYERGPDVRHGWVLADGGYRYGREPRLGRCGGPLRPLGPDAASAELVGGYVVWRSRTDPAINLIRLRDGRRFTVAGARSHTAGTGRELLVWTRGADPLYGTLAAVRLPG